MTCFVCWLQSGVVRLDFWSVDGWAHDGGRGEGRYRLGGYKGARAELGPLRGFSLSDTATHDFDKRDIS